MEIAKNKNSGLVFFNEFIVENFLYDIPKFRMNHYLELFFKNIKHDEIKETMRFIDLFFEKDGALTNIANKLYVHKNTVQYKILKLISQTGYDIRKPSEAIYFHLALKFYKILFGL